MSRTRRGSTSSRSSANSVPPPVPSRPPPVPPIPAEHRRLTRVPETQNGDLLTVPKTRPARSRGASAPGGFRPQAGLAPIEESQGNHFQQSLSPILACSSARGGGVPIAPWLEQVEFHQEASRQLAQSVSPRLRAPSSPAPVLPKYSLFPPPNSRPVTPTPPPRFVSSTSVTPSDMSRASSPGWSNEFPQPGNCPLFSVLPELR